MKIKRMGVFLYLVLLTLLAACGESVQSEPGSAQEAMGSSVSAGDNGIPVHIEQAVKSSSRTPEQVARDSARLPAEVLTLAGLNAGDRVAEFTTFGQYYSEILAEAIGPEGFLYMYDMPYLEQFGAIEGGTAFAESHDNAEYIVVHYNDIELPSALDAVYNVLYYHDLGPQEVETGRLNQKIFSSLKPGGTYLIVDHKAEVGSGWRDAGTIHRIDKNTIIEEVTAAGFDLIEDSDILSHPEEDRTAMVYNPGVRGGTDRAVLVFRKPQ